MAREAGLHREEATRERRQGETRQAGHVGLGAPTRLPILLKLLFVALLK